MTDRGKLQYAMARLYDGRERNEIITDLRERLEHLVGRMRQLQRFPQSNYKGFVKAELLAAIGMSIGVHQQLLGRLTSVSRGVRLKGGGWV